MYFFCLPFESCIPFSFGSPPPSLLRVIADWLTENPALLRTPLTLPPNAPPPRRQALLTAPLLGLLRWCIKAPLIEVACSKLLKKLSNEESSASSSSSPAKNASIIASATTQLTLTAVYSQLHLALLNCFMTQMEAAPSSSSSSSSLKSGAAMEPFSASQMMELAQEVVTLERETRAENSPAAPMRSQSPEIAMETETTSVSEETKAMNVAVDRLAQAIQVAKATNSLTTQPGDLNRIEAVLPSNSLLRVVVAHWDPPQRR